MIRGRRAGEAHPPTPASPARRLWLAVGLICLTACPVAAQDDVRAWQIAVERCILPFEEFALPEMSDVGPAEDLPDWVRLPAASEAWAMGDGIYLSLAGTPDETLATCAVHTLDPEGTLAEAYAAWAQTVIADGRYRPVEADDPGELTSTIWREPRMRVALDAVDDAVRILVFDVPEEARLRKEPG